MIKQTDDIRPVRNTISNGVHPNIVFWGTSEFALPSLEMLISRGYSVVAVITNPDEPVGRRQILTPPPVKMWAQKNKIETLQPENLKIESEANVFASDGRSPGIRRGGEFWKLKIPEADIYVVAAYGKIIPKTILNLPKYGALNIHPSLLPRWRGPSPIQYTILEGDTETGVTIIRMDELMDHGPIISIFNFQFSIFNLNYKELHDKLADLGAKLLIEVLPKYIRGEITPVPQDDSKATYSKLFKKEDGRIDWSKNADEIERMVRALNLWPGTWTLWPSDKSIYRVKIEEAQKVELTSPSGNPGFIWRSDEYPLLVKTSHGSLLVKRLTMEGYKSLDAQSFLRGRNIIGTNFV